MNEQQAYEKARRRVEAKIGFFIHLVVYIVVNAVLIVVNVSESPEYLWFKWPLIGWGIGVVFHALGVFFFSGGSVVKERMIEKEMGKQGSRSEKP